MLRVFRSSLATAPQLWLGDPISHESLQLLPTHYGSSLRRLRLPTSLHPYFPLSLPEDRDISLSYIQKVGSRTLGKQLGVAKILSKGQVTIPVEARKAMKLNLGDYVVFEEENGKLILSKAVLRKT